MGHSSRMRLGLGAAALVSTVALATAGEPPRVVSLVYYATEEHPSPASAGLDPDAPAVPTPIAGPAPRARSTRKNTLGPLAKLRRARDTMSLIKALKASQNPSTR